MKKLLCFFYFIVAMSLNSIAANYGLVNLGPVSQLVEIKYNSEACFSKIATDPAVAKQRRDSALINYNEIRVLTDRIIYQLSADMRSKNSVKAYKKLSNYYKTHDLGEAEGENVFIESYVLAFKDLHIIYKKFVYPDQPGVTKGLITPAIVLSIIDTGWTITKNIKDMRGKKVDGIIELLNNLRLNSPQELIKGK